MFSNDLEQYYVQIELSSHEWRMKFDECENLKNLEFVYLDGSNINLDENFKILCNALPRLSATIITLRDLEFTNSDIDMLADALSMAKSHRLYHIDLSYSTILNGECGDMQLMKLMACTENIELIDFNYSANCLFNNINKTKISRLKINLDSFMLDSSSYLHHLRENTSLVSLYLHTHDANTVIDEIVYTAIMEMLQNNIYIEYIGVIAPRHFRDDYIPISICDMPVARRNRILVDKIADRLDENHNLRNAAHESYVLALKTILHTYSPGPLNKITTHRHMLRLIVHYVKLTRQNPTWRIRHKKQKV